jgi:hypothetical protein
MISPSEKNLIFSDLNLPDPGLGLDPELELDFQL